MNVLITISLKFIAKGPIDNNPALIQMMAWHQIGDKPLLYPLHNEVVGGGILVSLHLSICLSIRPSVSLTSCVGSCYQTESANQWVCGTGSWWVALTLRYSQLVHSTLEWFWVSRRIFIHSHHNTFVFFLKTSVRPTSRVRSVSPTMLTWFTDAYMRL